jgi:TRAP-type C4-dicarboxylate transport system permease large subunit|tara:strand:- start:244 stop:513 length:270 start_codon:yes stop_codon:yes gene_type:complete
MSEDIKSVWKSSTTIKLAVAAILGAVSGWLTGELETGAAIMVAVTSLLAIFQRRGTQKAEVAADAAAEAAADAATVVRLTKPVNPVVGE